MFTDYLTQTIAMIRDQLLHSATPGELWQKAARAEELLNKMTASAAYNTLDVVSELDATVASNAPEIVFGEVMQHDLRRLIHDLSDAANVRADQAGEAVVTIDNLAREFGISTKTISRWRELGLVSRRFLIDGRKRVGFLRSSVERFVRANRKRVERACKFSQLSEDERQKIVELAKRLDHPSISRSEKLAELAATMQRSVETVRYTLRQHAEQHTEDDWLALDRGQNSNSKRKQRIYERYLVGRSIPALTRQFELSEASIRRIVNEARAEAIINLPLDYVASNEFDKPDAEDTILAALPAARTAERKTHRPAGLPAYLAALYDTPLLTREQEQHLFRKYNYLKCRAARSRDQLDPARPQSRLLDEIERLYDESVGVKHHLVQANLRLVVSLAKKRTDAASDFDKMVSDGNVSVMRAVEKFDYRLGNKFSTYATWAIVRNFANSAKAEYRHRSRFHSGTDELLLGRNDYRADHVSEEAEYDKRRRQVQRFIARLTARERKIIEQRFGLSDSEPRTLKEIGEQLGVSKERIRQIEGVAMEKLRRLITKRRNDII